jgi:hypothetical protein
MGGRQRDGVIEDRAVEIEERGPQAGHVQPGRERQRAGY